MSLSTEDVRAIADYARIAFNDEELEEMRTYLNSAVKLLDPIRELDVEGVEPTFHPIGSLSNVMAEDAVDQHGRSLDIDTALGNAGASEGRSFRVPSILGDEGGAA
ncbi:MAG: Asp-tRNA(Asn)/Glu-tRNA(Gln) amidotransferase subunit GatC [Atopobiaceae bacterium]|nr:Asp-tRNA(Asn)/Glu-tRNA(Gln) amidotransferase subunit GatC [Atopobiaceae bacterium]